MRMLSIFLDRQGNNLKAEMSSHKLFVLISLLTDDTPKDEFTKIVLYNEIVSF